MLLAICYTLDALLPGVLTAKFTYDKTEYNISNTRYSPLEKTECYMYNKNKEIL